MLYFILSFEIIKFTSDVVVVSHLAWSLTIRDMKLFTVVLWRIPYFTHSFETVNFISGVAVASPLSWCSALTPPSISISIRAIQMSVPDHKPCLRHDERESIAWSFALLSIFFCCSLGEHIVVLWRIPYFAHNFEILNFISGVAVVSPLSWCLALAPCCLSISIRAAWMSFPDHRLV
jgi:hypothetical protein